MYVQVMVCYDVALAHPGPPGLGQDEVPTLLYWETSCTSIFVIIGDFLNHSFSYYPESVCLGRSYLGPLSPPDIIPSGLIQAVTPLHYFKFLAQGGFFFSLLRKVYARVLEREFQ